MTFVNICSQHAFQNNILLQIILAILFLLDYDKEAENTKEIEFRNNHECFAFLGIVVLTTGFLTWKKCMKRLVRPRGGEL